jgi:hypothetical protein
MTQNGRWVYAKDLRVDDVVISRSLNKQRVTAVESSITKTLVYNFLVDDLHNYAVGDYEILVHNTNAPKKSDAQIYEELPDNISVKARRTPKNDAEKIAMDRIKADPSLGKEVRLSLNDPYYSTGVWRKMEYKKGTVVIHYVREIYTGVVKDFKFIND